jgi:hypothetical protein
MKFLHRFEQLCLAKTQFQTESDELKKILTIPDLELGKTLAISRTRTPQSQGELRRQD